MDKIYVFGFRYESRIYGFAVDSFVIDKIDGKKKLGYIANYISGSQASLKHDMGITSEWFHAVYEKFHPNGYELEFAGIFLRCWRSLESI